MKLNDRVRKHLASELEPGETIVATVMLANTVGTGGARPSGGLSSAATALGLPYAERHGIDLNDPRLRNHLLFSWCTLTEHRILFHKHKATSIRPTPGDLIEAHPRDGIRLSWFDTDGFALDNRIFHFDFPDETRLLASAILKARIRRKPYNDETFLFVEAMVAAATEVDGS